MVIEPENDHLFILTSREEKKKREKKNTLELFSFTSEVFIHLSDAEDENPENFYLISQKQENNKMIHEIILSFEEKVKIFHDFYKNSSFILEKKKKLCKIFENETKEKVAVPLKTKMISKKLSQYAKEIKENFESTISPNTRMFPFNYNFLQIMAYDQDFHNVEDKILGLINNEDKNLEISFHFFFQRDIHGRNCFDIAFLNRDTKLFKDFLIFIRKKFKITDLDKRYREYLNTKFFYKMFLIFEDNSIISEFLSFMFAAPLEFPPNHMSFRMKNPIFKALSEPSLPLKSLEKILKKIKEKQSTLEKKKKPDAKEILELDELVSAKCFYPCDFLDYSNEATGEIFKLISEFDPMNEIFESDAIIKLLEYKWNKYAKKRYFSEAGMFLIFLLIYIINVDFLFISRMGTAVNELTEGHLIFSICSGIIDVIIFIFVFRLINIERNQLKYFGFSGYFSSFWNYITFSLTSTFLDLISCLDVYSNFDLLKSMQSLTIFFAFFRLMSYARGFEGSSFMIKLIIRVIFDIRYFLILMILFIISLSCSGII